MKTERERWLRIKEAFDWAADLDGDERQRFIDGLSADERTLAAEIEKLLEVDDDAASFMSKRPVLDDEPRMIGEMVGSYRVVREVGRGGMGAVFEAVREDGDFDHRVAVKLTGHNLFSDDLIRRFRAEKQILANLEHPNIVRLLDGGVTSHHIPYYAMEYVEGTPLTNFCREHKLDINDRLALFAQVCDAVAYAHRQLVVHRDLKPTNILVTTDGQVKLLDFGIAKVLGPEAASQTMTQNAPLTPEYASPEQVRGGPISTASDIYSLGALLFELLSDLRPAELYGAAAGEITFSVLTLEPLSPSAALRRSGGGPRKLDHLARQLKGDLDNIVLKCLRKEPSGRYSSADQLGEDIRAYLGGRPVKAHPESRAYRLRKFVGRNRFVVVSATAALLLIIGAAAVSTWQFLVARQQRMIAEQRFQQVRKVANALIFEYHDEVAKLEGSLALREKMISDAVNYLDAISTGEITDPELLFELGVAYRKVGDVHGLPYANNLGRLDLALVSYRKSVASFGMVIELQPDNLEAVTHYVDASRGLYGALEKSSFPKEARQGLQEAIAMLNRHADSLDGPGLVALNRLRIDEVVVFDPTETNLFRYQRLTELKPYLDDMERRFPDQQDNFIVREVLENYTGNAARFAAYDAEDAGNSQEAERLYRLSIDHYNSMRSSSDKFSKPTDKPTSITNRQYVFYSSVASSYAGLNDQAMALETINKTESILEPMLKETANHTARLRLLALARVKQVLLLKQNRVSEAMESIEAAKKEIADLLATDPTNIEKTVYGMYFCQQAARLYKPGRDDAKIRENQAELDRYIGIIHEKYGPDIKLTAYF